MWPCDHVKGLFLLAFCFFFFFLALPNPSFYNLLDTFLSSRVDPYRPVPSLVLALPFPARISPSSVLSYHTLLYPPSLNLAFSPSLLVYIFAVFHSIDPRHNECWWKRSRRSLRRNRFTRGWHGRCISKRNTYWRKFIRRRWHWRFRTWRSGNCRLTNAEVL